MENKLIECYKKMYLIRATEEIIIDNYYDDEMKTPMHMSKGSEAIAVGICEELEGRGQYFSTYRSHAPYLASGGDLNQFFAEMYGKKDGRYSGKSGSMHIASPENGHMSSSAIVASNIPVAVGAAWANKMQNNGKIVVVFFGDGAIDEGNFWESVNMACVWKLPIIFVCEDNRLAVNTVARDRQGYSDINKVMSNFNMTTSYSLGVDVQDVIFDIRRNIRIVDTLSEPVFMRLEYYRYLEHVGTNSDADADYRNDESWNRSDENDPIFSLRKLLISIYEHEDKVVEIENKIYKEVDIALQLAKNGDFSNVNKTYKDVFSG